MDDVVGYWDHIGFNQELKELAEKYKMRSSLRFVHRYHCATRHGDSVCSCIGRNEYVLYRQDMEDAESSRQAFLSIGEHKS